MPIPFTFKRHSLKTRTAVAVTLLFILFSVACGYLGDRYLDHTIRDTVNAGQFSYVTSLAQSLDDKLWLVQNSLINAAEHLGPEIVASPDKSQDFIDALFGMKSLFDNALFLFSTDGKIIAETPFLVGRRGRDISFRDYFRTTMATGKPYISVPYLSTHKPGHPAIILTAPVRDRQGRIIAVLAGSFDLLGKNNILANLATMKSGKQGYVFLIMNDRTVIMHPDRSRIMKQDAPPGSNLMFDKAIAGFEGSGETVNSRGLHALASFKRLQSTGWILGANFSVEEAFAPLESARHFYVGGLALATILVIVGIWWMMHRCLSPLTEIAQYIAMPEHAGTHLPPVFDTGDEIGTLSRVYNSIITEQRQEHEALRDSEERFRELSFLDPLTGLSNRRLFEDRLEQAIAKSRRYGMHFGLLTLDLDKFKEINDTFGHEAGDLVLRETAERIRACCKRDLDTISRTGGDEFCIILIDCGGREQLSAIADQLLQQFERPFQLENSQVEVTMSIGISMFPDNGTVIKELKIASDRAMYAAKKAGRNTFRFWEPYTEPRTMLGAIKQRRKSPKELCDALPPVRV